MGVLATITLILFIWIFSGWIGLLIARVTRSLKTDDGRCCVTSDMIIVYAAAGPAALMVVLLYLFFRLIDSWS